MREDEGTWLGHVLEHVAIELQNIAGESVTFGKTRGAGRPASTPSCTSTRSATKASRPASSACGCSARCCPRRSARPTAFPKAGAGPRRATSSSASRSAARSGPSTASLVKAAEARGIPWLRLNDQSLVQLGHGKYQQRIQATVTGRTPHIAVELASDKEETNKILATLGLPVPRQELVQSEGQAVRAARRIGFPVVTKPYNGNHGRGISIRLTTDEEVAQGFARRAGALALGHRRDLPRGRRPPAAGRERRARRGHAPHARARGRRRRAHHRRARRGREPGPAPRRRPREGADAARARRAGARRCSSAPGSPPESVPAAGAGRVPALDRQPVDRRHGHRRHRRHPPRQPRDGGARGARRSASTWAASTSSRPTSRESYRKIGGGICEVNAAPGFRMHVAPSEGTPRDVAGPVIDMLFPPGTPSRVPIAARHRHQRQDDHGAHARAHHQDGGLHAGPDHHRRRLHRRPAHRAGRHDGPGVGAHGARRPADRHRGARDGARRPAARRHGRARGQRRRGAQRAVRPPRPQGHRHARAARRGEARRRRGRHRLRGAERRRPAGAAHVRLHRGEEHLLRDDESRSTRWCASTSAPAAAPARSRRA